MEIALPKKRGRPKKVNSTATPLLDLPIDSSVFTIKCQWKPISQFSFGQQKERKCGRYHGSYFYNMKDFGEKRWAVTGYILVNHEEHKEKGYSEEDIVSACLTYLNTPPPKKKYAKKVPKPQYGILEPHQVKFKNKDGEQYLEVILSTTEKKNKFFWGEGLTM